MNIIRLEKKNQSYIRQHSIIQHTKINEIIDEMVYNEWNGDYCLIDCLRSEYNNTLGDIHWNMKLIKH